MNQDKTFFEYKDEKGLDLDHNLCGGNRKSRLISHMINLLWDAVFIF